MFHFKDGWFFERNPDGSVRVLKMSDPTGSAVKVSEANIDPDAWASIVSFVSAEKNAIMAFSAVREFHMEGILRAPASGATPGEVSVESIKAIDRLGDFIRNEVPGEPSADEGAVDTAIRLLKAAYLEPVETTIPPDAIELPPPGAKPEQPGPAPPYEAEAPPEQPAEGEGKPPGDN